MIPRPFYVVYHRTTTLMRGLIGQRPPSKKKFVTFFQPYLTPKATRFWPTTTASSTLTHRLSEPAIKYPRSYSPRGGRLSVSLSSEDSSSSSHASPVSPPSPATPLTPQSSLSSGKDAYLPNFSQLPVLAEHSQSGKDVVCDVSSSFAALRPHQDDGLDSPAYGRERQPYRPW